MKNPRVGIGVITYNRPVHLSVLLESLNKFTPEEYEIVVFDDATALSYEESLHGLYPVLKSQVNHGVIINKNRALFFFNEIHRKDIVILIEDDCLIEKSDWVEVWANITLEYGHMNYLPPWFTDRNHLKFRLRAPDSMHSPALFTVVTGQVTGIRMDVLNNEVGYLNPQFKGYGHGHVEWTNRFIELGYGGSLENGARSYFSLAYGIGVQKSISNRLDSQLLTNSKLFNQFGGKGAFVRIPWETEAERADFANLSN